MEIRQCNPQPPSNLTLHFVQRHYVNATFNPQTFRPLSRNIYSRRLWDVRSKVIFVHKVLIHKTFQLLDIWSHFFCSQGFPSTRYLVQYKQFIHKTFRLFDIRYKNNSSMRFFVYKKFGVNINLFTKNPLSLNFLHRPFINNTA